MIAALFRPALTAIKMKTERGLREKDMDNHQFSTFHYWYGYCMKEIKHSFLTYCQRTISYIFEVPESRTQTGQDATWHC